MICWQCLQPIRDDQEWTRYQHKTTKAERDMHNACATRGFAAAATIHNAWDAEAARDYNEIRRASLLPHR